MIHPYPDDEINGVRFEINGDDNDVIVMVSTMTLSIMTEVMMTSVYR